MKETKINVYSKLNNIEENNKFLAIMDDKIIKYIDLEDNKMIIDIENNAIIRENIDYIFNLDFINDKITINIKKLNKLITKDIKTLVIKRTNKEYLVRYLLTDENIINEYCVKF